MQGMFRTNGGCGYVKKPEFLLLKGPHNEVFDPKIALPVKKTLKVRYNIEKKSVSLVTSSEHLPLPVGKSLPGEWLELRFQPNRF